MLWYLLYPLRRTTSAPELAPGHPLRRTLSHYGIYIARNVATTLLVSVAVTTALLYPIPFLYSSDFTSSASNLPHHVWTGANPLKDSIDAQPDVVMRSIWVYGSYMQALKSEILLGALELQDELMGSTANFSPRHPATEGLPQPSSLSRDLSPYQRDAFHVVNGLTNQSWFFHSPLLYWSNNRDAIASDMDILETVNEHRKQHTSVNITLRHSVIFSGERFEDRALVAADALVITLIYLRDSPVGHQWKRKAVELTSRPSDKWTVYPKDGHSLQSELYEFQFLPISLQDSLMLALAYTITSVYVVQNLTKLPAIKSRPGLILAVLAQIFMSIMSSFTICAILDVDLSRIPRAAYPIVVISMSLENVLRLIKEAILSDHESNTSSRVGEAFGKTTHVALVSVAEHLVLLWVISRLVATGLSGFCTFLAIAVVFDFVYLSTFFLSVLSVEVRRTELGEAIEKAVFMRRHLRSSASPQPQSPTMHGLIRPSWIADFLQGNVDASTRIAGTVILFCFVIIAQWHFFGTGSLAYAAKQLLHLITPGAKGNDSPSSWGSSSPQFAEVHQARSPASWLRLQAHETAGEVINVVRPSAHSYVARVYEPLVFVLNGADRMPGVSERRFLPAVYDFVRHQWKLFIITIIAVPAAVRIFVNYLLWTDADEASDHNEPANCPHLSIKSLDQGHTLDVALLAASSNGLVVSVGLDRRIRVWNVPFGCANYVLTEQDSSKDVPFPVLSLAINDSSSWLAILSTYMVMLWDLENRRWAATLPVDLCGQKPEAFFFAPARRHTVVPPVVVVRRNGTFSELWADTCESMDHLICRSPLLCAVPLHCRTSAAGSITVPVHSEDTIFIIAASRSGYIHRVAPTNYEWMSESSEQQTGKDKCPQSLVALAPFSAYLVVYTWSVDLVDLQTFDVLHTFKTAKPVRAQSLRTLYSKRRQGPADSPELSSFSLVYVSAETGNCVIQTFLPEQNGGSIAVLSNDSLTGILTSSDSTCCTWEESRQVIREIANPGKWEALPNGSIVGVRRQGRAVPNGRAGSRMATGRDAVGRTGSGLRRRGLDALAGKASAGPIMSTCVTMTSTAAKEPVSSRDSWEAWSVWITLEDRDGDDTGSRNYVAQMLGVDQGDLLVMEPGPIVQLGAGTVALGLGTSIKIITLGHERFGSTADLLGTETKLIRTSNASGRRRKNRSLSKML